MSKGASRAVLVTGCSAGGQFETLARLAGTPDGVAAAVLEAIAATRPKAPYPVSALARLLLAGRTLLPDRAWDGFLARACVRRGGGRG